MSRVFRLHEGQGGTGWFSSTPITKDQLTKIKTADKDIATSIPSPFAQLDLVKSAFEWVVANGARGDKAQHKLVSEALDVAQLFFLYPKYRDKIKIVSWNPQERIEELLKAQPRHSSFINTVKTFWKEDGEVYNFQKVKRLYFVLNNTTNQIIGSTSPATLFLASPDISTVSADLQITAGPNVLFDEKCTPLSQRDKSFVEYIFTLSKQADFAQTFPEVYAYLKATKEELDNESQRNISNLTSEDLKNYAKCPVLDNDNDTCEILGMPLGVQRTDLNFIETESDFVIFPDLPIYGPKPLILPNDKFSEEWTYTTKGILWNPNNTIPVKNTESPGNSRLPVQGDCYYWLASGNFLENAIIELPYSIDSVRFKTCGSNKYLLPLTPLFFQYFKPDDVDNYLTLSELAGGGVEVKLQIPVGQDSKGKKYINYSKIYHETNIIKTAIHLAILPFTDAPAVRFPYTIGVIDDREKRMSDITITCYHNGAEISLTSPVTRNPGRGGEVKSYYYTTANKFNAIRINGASVSGTIIPIFPPYSGNRNIDFAIDFGTTNTHIQYAIGGSPSLPLDSPLSVPFLQSLMNKNDKTFSSEFRENEVTFQEEMLPFSSELIPNLAKKGQLSLRFPSRTALVYNENTDFSKPLELFKYINNYFLLETRHVPNYLELTTQLKWSNYSDPEDEKKVEYYIRFLIQLAFYKTLLAGGDIQKTTITWFYPVSMDEGEINKLFKIWQAEYTGIFGMPATSMVLQGIPESIAPYLFYRGQVEGLNLSIDIGGGSSDIAVFNKENAAPELISSFKFAGNAIFGDGYPSKEFKNNTERNGFVKTFYHDIEKAVAEDQENKLILENIVHKRKDSADFSNYLFSLEQNREMAFSYTRLLEKNKRLKLTILIFYSAIAYYSANLLKRSNIRIPQYILFSGSGSKSLSILDSSDGHSNIAAMFEFIFKKTFNEKNEENKQKITIKLANNPKEITCIGALTAGIRQNIKNPPIKFWLGGNTDKTKWGKTYDKEKDLSEIPSYEKIDEKAKIEIEASITDFYKTLDEYIASIRFEEKYMIESEAYDSFKATRSQNIQDLIIKGTKAFYKKGNQHIEESLFFYPLIGILNKLAFELSLNDEDTGK